MQEVGNRGAEAQREHGYRAVGTSAKAGGARGDGGAPQHGRDFPPLHALGGVPNCALRMKYQKLILMPGIMSTFDRFTGLAGLSR